jgi:hypothetical protein
MKGAKPSALYAEPLSVTRISRMQLAAVRVATVLDEREAKDPLGLGQRRPHPRRQRRSPSWWR